MRLKIVEKSDLTQSQCRYLDERLAAPEHANDSGPIRAWNTHQQFLYVFVYKQLKLPIAISEASGRPTSVPGWWIDSRFRGQGFGNELVDLLASYLKAHGVSRIGPIPIDTYRGEYHE